MAIRPVAPERVREIEQAARANAQPKGPAGRIVPTNPGRIVPPELRADREDGER